MTRTKERSVALIGALLITLSASQARADEEMRPLAVSGDWVAAAHSSSLISAPDMCLVASITKKAIIRVDAENVDFRVVNKDWSLPSDVKGQITIEISSRQVNLEITSNTDNMVSATMTKEETIALLDDTAKTSSMTVKTGKEKPSTVSLAGSNKVLSAFRTCAGLKGNSGGGNNPF